MNRKEALGLAVRSMTNHMELVNNTKRVITDAKFINDVCKVVSEMEQAIVVLKELRDEQK